MAQALNVPPSGQWQGNDGLWSTFEVDIGVDPTVHYFFVSTSQSIPYVIANTPSACEGISGNCDELRGGLYIPPDSSSWSGYPGYYNATNILYYQHDAAITAHEALFGNETLGLSSIGSGLPTLQDNLLGVLTTEVPFLGLLGIYPQTFPLNGTRVPSFFSKLHSQNLNVIPSLSWGYQAGAIYRSTLGILGNLVLGGYQAARFTPTGITYTMNADINRYLTIGLQALTIEKGGRSIDALASGPIDIALDSTLPYLWLPESVCQVFESTFLLTYNETAQMYFVDATSYAALSQSQPSIVFRIGPDNSGGASTEITLPYQAFNLTAMPPLANNKTYFPLKRATSPDQYMLGRTFLQEAYIFADFERNTFEVNPAKWTTTTGNGLTAVYPPKTGSSFVPSSNPTPVAQSSGSSTPVGAIAGGVVGGILAILLVIGVIFFLRRRRRRNTGAAELAADESESRSAPPPLYDEGVPMAQRSEMDGKAKAAHELNAGAGAVAATGGAATPDAMHPYSDAGMLSSGATSPANEMDANVYYELPGHRHDGSADYGMHEGMRGEEAEEEDDDDADEPVVAGSSGGASSEATAIEGGDMSPQTPGLDGPQTPSHHGSRVPGRDGGLPSGYVSPVSAAPRGD